MKTRLDRTLIGILALTFMFCIYETSAFARDRADIVPLGNWRAVEAMEKDASISVHMNSGHKIEGKFLGLDPDAIHLKIDNQERIYPRASITEVWQLRIPDRKLNGTLIGMLAGAGAGIIAAAAGGFLEPTGDTAGRQIGPGFIMAGIGIGAAIGATSDAMIRGNKLLYRR
jgi:hypothetical protein